MPTVEQAMKAAAAIATAATRVGAPDPREAVRHIEANPTEIDGFAQVLSSALTGLDQALTSAGTARSTMTASHRGQAADLAETDASTRIEAATQGRERLGRLGAEIGGIAEQLDTFQRQAAGQITAVATATAPAAAIVLTGPNSPEYPGAARQVAGAVQAVTAAARTYQQQVEDLRGRFGLAFENSTTPTQAAAGGRPWSNLGKSIPNMPTPEATEEAEKKIQQMEEKLRTDPEYRRNAIQGWQQEKYWRALMGPPHSMDTFMSNPDYFASERMRIVEEAILEDAQARAEQLGLPEPTSPAGGTHAARDGQPNAGR